MRTGGVTGFGDMHWVDYLIYGWVGLFVASICLIELSVRDDAQVNSWLSVIATSFVVISILAILAVSFAPHGS